MISPKEISNVVAVAIYDALMNPTPSVCTFYLVITRHFIILCRKPSYHSFKTPNRSNFSSVDFSFLSPLLKNVDQLKPTGRGGFSRHAIKYHCRCKTIIQQRPRSFKNIVDIEYSRQQHCRRKGKATSLLFASVWNRHIIDTMYCTSRCKIGDKQHKGISQRKQYCNAIHGISKLKKRKRTEKLPGDRWSYWTSMFSPNPLFITPNDIGFGNIRTHLSNTMRKW